MLRDFCDNLLEAAESWDTGSLMALAKKCGLDREVIQKIETDAAWGEITVKNLRTALPELFAKWLNAFGISAEYRFELMVGSAVVSIGANHLSLKRRILTMAKEKGTLHTAAPQPAPVAKAA